MLGLPRTCRVDQKMKNPSRADAPEGFADLSIFFPDTILRAEHLHAYADRADWRCGHTSARRTTAVGGVRADMSLSTYDVTISSDTHSISPRENQSPRVYAAPAAGLTSGTCPGYRRVARLRRSRCSFEHAVADDRRRPRKGQVGTADPRSLASPSRAGTRRLVMLQKASRLSGDRLRGTSGDHAIAPS